MNIFSDPILVPVTGDEDTDEDEGNDDDDAEGDDGVSSCNDLQNYRGIL